MVLWSERSSERNQMLYEPTTTCSWSPHDGRRQLAAATKQKRPACFGGPLYPSSPSPRAARVSSCH